MLRHELDENDLVLVGVDCALEWFREPFSAVRVVKIEKPVFEIDCKQQNLPERVSIEIEDKWIVGCCVADDERSVNRFFNYVQWHDDVWCVD